MPMTLREANKTKRPALVLIQAMSPKKSKRKSKVRKEKEASIEEGIEHISEIETRQAKIHTDASNSTPAGQTRTGRGVKVTNKMLVRHASQKGPEDATAQSSKLGNANLDMDANPDNLNDNGPPTRSKGTKKKPVLQGVPKVRTAIEARKREQVVSDARSVKIDDSTNLEMENCTGVNQRPATLPAKSIDTGDLRPGLGQRLVAKRAHTYDLTDPNTNAIRSPTAKRMRASRLESNSQVKMIPVPKLNLKSQVQLTKGANTAIATKKPGISPFENEIEIPNSLTDTPVDVFDDEDPEIELEETLNFELEGQNAPDEARVVSATLQLQDTGRPTWADTSGDLEGEKIDVKSDGGQVRASSEPSGSEYEPSIRSDIDGSMPVDSEVGLGLDDLSHEPIGITSNRKYRAPFVYETYDQYKEDLMMDEDESSIYIRRAYYGDLLDELGDGSQPIEEDLSPLNNDYFHVSDPHRNALRESTLAKENMSETGFRLNRVQNKKRREGNESMEGNPKHHPSITNATSVSFDNNPVRCESQSRYSGDNLQRDHEGGDWSEGLTSNLSPPIDQKAYQKKGKERSDPFDLPSTITSEQTNDTFNAVNDFGGMSDHDELDQGEEYFHAKSSPLKDGRRLDNQFMVHINDTPKAKPRKNKRSIERQPGKTEHTIESEHKLTSDLKIRARVKNEHLPAELTQPVDTWKTIILPTFFNWLASQEDPWNQTPSAIVDALETICRACVRGSYTLKRNGDTSGVKSTEYKRVVQKISDWKSKLGSTAIWAINTIFECRPEEFGDSDETRVAWANWHQYGCRFLFADVKTNPPKGMFQSNAFLHVLGAHFALFATDAKAWALGLTCDSTDHEPWGAIAIAAAAVERAIVLWSDRDLTVEIMSRAAKSKSHSIDFPKKMNARGVETQSHALFAETKWGSRTQYYYRNIKAKVKKGTWNWMEIYGLLGPHIKALQKRERSTKPKVQKPSIEIIGDDDLLEDAADMSGTNLSFQPAPPKPWISKLSQVRSSHQTSQPALSSNKVLPPSQVSSQSSRVSALPPTSSTLAHVSSLQPQSMPSTRHSPYLGLGNRSLAVSEKQALDHDSSDMTMTDIMPDPAAQLVHPTRLHHPLPPFNSTEMYQQDPQESRSKAFPTIPVKAASRHHRHHSVTSSTRAETPSMNHLQQHELRGYSRAQPMEESSKRPMDVYSSSHSMARGAAIMPVKHSRKARTQGQVTSMVHHHSQSEAGPSRRY